MADIALRDYDYEIAAMLDAGELDDAIAHCLHIINIYPKHLQAYRLLAQAFVQNKRGSDAILVYQRLLAAVPDDFDVHRAMSALYEENGNLEAALWHAKRAFEIQPAEKAVQDRLRELFTLRDGKAPPMRLTRGALARMYANQADQTEQAISEMCSILSEKPERVDLQLLLGRVYHQAGQDDNAAQACIAVLEALPHALEANCILAEIYDAAGQVEQAVIHWARVKELEPYDKRLEDRMVKAGVLTDDNTLVVLEDMTEPVTQPGWENSLGINPSNLVAVFTTPEMTGSPAGEKASQTAMDDIAAANDDLLAWLNETPPGPSDTVGTWLDGMESQPAGESGQTPSEPVPSPEIPETSLPLPDWLYNLAKPKPPENLPEALVEPAGETEDDWLAHLEEIRRENLPNSAKPKIHETTEEIPDWLKSLSGVKSNNVEETGGSVPTPAEELPEWITSGQEQGEQGEAETSQPASPAGQPLTELPEWLEGLAEEGAPAQDFTFEISPETESIEEAEELAQTPSIEEPDLLEEISAISSSKEEYHPQDIIPDWLKSLEDIPEAGAEAFRLEPDEIQEEPAEILPSEPEEIHEEFVDIFPSEAEERETMTEEYHPVEHLPDWLKALEDTEEKREEYHPVEHLPDWLKALEDKESVPEKGHPQAPQARGTTPEGYRPVEHIPEWLKALETMEPLAGPEKPRLEMAGAGRMEPEIANEKIPDWLKEIGGEEEPEQVQPESEIAESLPEWSVEDQEAPAETGGETFAEETSKSYGPGREWQTDIAKLLESSEIAESNVADALAMEQAREKKAEEKRKSKSIDQTQAGEVAPERVTPIPEWLLDNEGVPETAEEIAEALEEVEHPKEKSGAGESLPDWLAEVQRAAESFEAMVKNVLTGQKAPRAARETESAAQEESRPSEEIPDWMREIMRENIPDAKSVEETESVEPGGIPEWLKQGEEQAPQPAEEEGLEIIEAEAIEEEPQFENISDAIDWLENVTDQGAEPGEPIAAPAEEVVPSFEIPEEELEEPQIELTSDIKQPRPVSSAWVLESLATTQPIEPFTEAVESAMEGEPSAPALKAININKAGLADLEQLPSIGFRLAQNIINYRQSHGEFRSLDELRNVPKLDASILEEIASYVHFEDMPVYTENAEYRGEDLVLAKNALARGDLGVAISAYSKQIALRVNLPEVVHDLLSASEQYPDELAIWQTLGDAYLQAGSLDEALDSYRRAEEILQ